MIHANFQTHSQNMNAAYAGRMTLLNWRAGNLGGIMASAIHGHPRYPDRRHPSGTQPGSDFYRPAACYPGYPGYASCPSASC